MSLKQQSESNQSPSNSPRIRKLSAKLRTQSFDSNVNKIEYDYLEEDHKKNIQLKKDRYDLNVILRSQEGDHTSSFVKPRNFHSSLDLIIDSEIIPNLEESIHILESEDAVVLPLSFKYQENLIAWVWSRLIVLKLGKFGIFFTQRN